MNPVLQSDTVAMPMSERIRMNFIKSLSRRDFFLLSAAAGTSMIRPSFSEAASRPETKPELRGTIDPGRYGLVADASRSSASYLGDLLRKAAARDMPVFLPPGTYPLSQLDLPENTRLTGIAGSSRIVFTGGSHFLRARGLKRLSLSGLVIDGANLPLSAEAKALFSAQSINDLMIEDCEFTGSRLSGIHLAGCRATLRRNRIGNVAEYGVLAVDGVNSAMTDNEVTNCGNGGILVHRSVKGSDRTMVTGNRIIRTRADYGGTGPFGNAINLYRADDVLVSGNHIADSAFTPIRAKPASNVQITNNQCLNSGETAIYSEFGFEGALVSGNLVDGGANGISVVNFDSGGRLGVISSNIVRNIRDTGPYVHDSVGFGYGIAAEADVVISANVVERVARFGLLAGWGAYLRNVLVTGNIIREAQTGMAVSVVEEAGQATIANNLFEKTPKGAIIGYRWHDAATGDLVAGSSAHKHLTIMNNRSG